jgi:TolB-like protein/DNA-binding winged helix-turn-helix (wHTH) protein/Tfp pilus assembly protein PilF
VAVRLRSKHLHQFGLYTLDPDERVLFRDGQPVALPPKDLETLLVLVENAGHIVEKEYLLEKVWPGVFIEENNLSRRIFNLRQLLGLSPEGRPYIETVPKRGYRFTATLVNHAEAAAFPEHSAQGQSEASVGQKKSFKLWPLVLSLALALTAVLFSRYLWPPSTPPPGKVMLAVLPFENLSEGQNDYFADGLTEEMIAQLGQLQPAKLGVIARTSTVRYKNTKETAAQIGRELGVNYLLEGSVRRADGRVRITAQLVRTSEQTNLWSEAYERPLADVLDIQREIAGKITYSLSIHLLPTEAKSAFNPPANFESYDKYLLGLHDLGQGTRNSINLAVEHFQEGVAIDPRNARLYSGMGEAYEALNTYYSSPAEMMPKVKAAALQALQLDPDLASAHVLLADVQLLFEWNWPAAEKEYRRALEINPSLPEAQFGYAAYLGTLGRFDEALLKIQQGYLADPLAIDSRSDALWIYYFSGRMQETVQQAQKASELAPQAGLPYAILAMADAQLGRRDETERAATNALRFANSPSVITAAASALAHVGERNQAGQLLSKALAMAKERYVCRFLVAATYAELGEKQQAMDSLEQGYLQRST